MEITDQRTTRFFNKVDKPADDGCWLWTGLKTKEGYGRFAGGRAHRYSFLISFGPIPDGQIVLHSCDNSSCVNPNHLSLGTHKSNALEKMAKGRGFHARGEASGTAKLTEMQVRLILSHKGQITQGELAKMFNLSRVQVCRIHNGKSWKHIHTEVMNVKV